LYGGLALLVSRFVYGDLRRSPVSAMLIAASFTIFYGFSDEIHQSFVPTRYAQASDFAADMVGALLAVGAWYVIFHPKRRPALLLQAQPHNEKVADDVQV
jgi:VanZ family protein